MKIVSDFDGVVTDQTEEATLVATLFSQRLEALLGSGAIALLERARAEVEQRPQLHGWRSAGRITAYGNEDLFIRNNAVAACLDAWGEGRATLGGAGVDSFSALAQWAYDSMVRRTHKGELRPMDADAAHAMQSWLTAGHEVVVVSNSGTERILQLLAGAGLDTTHPRLSVRGGANKFELGQDKRGFVHDGYWLDTNRPRYEEILRYERPDVVIGDVVSLDLALPLFLQREEAAFSKLRLCLRVRPYTPTWARQMFAEGTRPAACFAYEQPSELLSWLR